MTTISRTFTEFDKFDLHPFAKQLLAYLKAEYPWIEGSFVLSLNAPFGSGKTTFFEMWRHELKSPVVYLNAWESDFQKDALLAIVSALISSLPTKPDEENSIKEAAGQLCKFTLSIGNDVVRKFTGIDVIKAGEHAKNGQPKEPLELGQTCFEIYREKKKVFDKLKTLLSLLVGKSNDPVIVIVDELDRCRPDYAVEFLETIKHFFDIHGLIFILGIDKQQLASSVSVLFGNELNFDEYYRKFAHRNASLPVYHTETSKKFCSKLVDEYLSTEAFVKKGRASSIGDTKSYAENLVNLATTFSLSARQTHELFRIASHVISAKEGNSIKFGWSLGAVFMSAISIHDNKLYHKVGKQRLSAESFTTFLMQHKFWIQDEGFSMACILFKGLFGNTISPDKAKPHLRQLGVINGNADVSFPEKYTEHNFFFQNSGHLGKRIPFVEIYELIEGLKTFEE